MDYEYEIQNNEATITKYKGTSKDVIIPNKIENIPVTTIRKYAFYNFYNNELTSIVSPETLTTIGKYAFRDNKLITSIVLPDKFRTEYQVQSIFDFGLEELDNKNRKFVSPYMSKLLSERITYYFHDIIVEHTTPSMALVKEVLKTTNTSTNKSVIRGTIA